MDALLTLLRTPIASTVVAAAPYVVARGASALNTSTTPKTAAGIAVQIGDVLVVKGSTADAGTTLNAPTGGTGLSWTPRQTDATASHCAIYVWTAPVVTAETLTLSIASAGSITFEWGFTYEVWRGSSGVGTSAKALGTGTPSLSIALSANSGVSALSSDWAAVTTARAYLAVNGLAPAETGALAGDGTTYGTYSWYRQDTGAAGTDVLGMTSPVGQTYSIAAVELLAASSGPSGSGTASAASSATGSALVLKQASGAASATSTATGAALVLVFGTGAASAASSATGTGSVVQTISGSGAASASSSATGSGYVTKSGSGSASASSSATGSSLVLVLGSGSSSSSSSATGASSLLVLGSGAASSVSSASGAARVDARGSGSASATSSSSGAARVDVRASGAGAATSAASGTAIVSVRGSGAASAASSATGVGSVSSGVQQITGSGAASSQSSATGSSYVVRFGSGAAAASSTAVGSSRVDRIGIGTASAASSASGAARVDVRALGVAAASSLASAIGFVLLLGNHGAASSASSATGEGRAVRVQRPVPYVRQTYTRQLGQLVTPQPHQPHVDSGVANVVNSPVTVLHFDA